MFRITAWLRRIFPAFFGEAPVLEDTGTARILTVTLSPDSGPPTTMVDIRVSGADAGDQVRAVTQAPGAIGGSGVKGSPRKADANGVATFTDTPALGFSAGDTITILAEAGSPTLKGSAEYQVT